ncbi:hypothetical protein SARC_15778 [Sphaeroforma arctica JP610]|uniref:Uncharacterized protein n=1 Tax=Sphaeroforma arctica JP610 TaxID=667725 RepID=A0A0L0F4R4_9EUKA|nr:hypothetical protein SARC_15778 [Sphaeroforma arctica JP610]KNC71682.1 hypothetical protein SARC_15778 [Sphaeroforma arctica JP610]|eukprot:XP_014145584.1 hypothetical protein SARC_15778 [Sphaeroforma arctica JP610]
MRKEQSHSVVSLKARKRLSGDFGNQINSLRPPLRSVASMANFKTYISDDDEEQTPTGSPERHGQLMLYPKP